MILQACQKQKKDAALTEREVVRSSCWWSIDLQGAHIQCLASAAFEKHWTRPQSERNCALLEVYAQNAASVTGVMLTWTVPVSIASEIWMAASNIKSVSKLGDETVWAVCG